MNNKKPPEIWEFFYLKGAKEKPADKQSFITKLQEDDAKLTLLTSGMENIVKKKLNRALTKTQMRNIYNLITDVSYRKNPAKLEVKLIYMAGKSDNWDIKNFIKLLIEVYKQDQSKDKQLTIDFIESALSYHKFHATN